MLISYNEGLLGSKNSYNINYSCQMNPSIQAATKLLKEENFKQKNLVCNQIEKFSCKDYESLEHDFICSIQLEELIETNLEFINTCFSTYYHEEIDPFNYTYDSLENNSNPYYIETVNRVSGLIHRFYPKNEFELNYETLIGNNESQIKIKVRKYKCEFFYENKYLKTCGDCNKFVFDIGIVFVKYNGFGDYAFRFIIGKSFDSESGLYWNQCNNRYSLQDFLNSSCNGSYAEKIDLNIYLENLGNLDIQFINQEPSSYILKKSAMTVSFDGSIMY